MDGMDHNADNKAQRTICSKNKANQNTVLLQMFRECFTKRGSKNSAFNFKLGNFVNISEVLSSDQEYCDKELLKLVPLLDGKYLTLYTGYHQVETVEKDKMTQKGTIRWMEFCKSVDYVLSTQMYKDYFETTLKNGKQRLSTGNGNIAEDPVRKRKRNVPFSYCERVIPRTIVPKTVETIFQKKWYPIGLHRFGKPDEWGHFLLNPGMENDVKQKGLKEFVNPPPPDQDLDECWDDNVVSTTKIFTTCQGMREGKSVTVLEIGMKIMFRGTDNNDKETKIVDFERDVICISRPPWHLRDWNPHKPVLLIKAGEEGIETKKLLPTSGFIVVKRNEPASLEIVKELEAKARKKMEERKERMNTLTNDQQIVERSRVFGSMPLPYDSGKYTGPTDPYYRYLNELPEEHDSLGWEHTGAAMMSQNGNTECNVCHNKMKWNSEKLLEDSAGAYFNQFLSGYKHAKKGRFELKRATGDILEHSQKHVDSIKHCYTLPKSFVGAKMGCWPFELRVVDVAQEILWDEFHAAGGIPRLMCQMAVKKRDDSWVRARFMKILGTAIGTVRHPSDRFFKRLYGAGTVIPAGYLGVDGKQEGNAPIAEANKAGRKNFFIKVEEELDRVYERMSSFPFLTFLLCFDIDGGDEKRIGYGWNSLCLFFVSGLYDHVYFPWIPQKMVSYKTLMDFVVDSYVTLLT